MATQAAPKKTRVNQDAITKAAREGRFIKTDAKAGNLTLGGAPKRWANPLHAGDVYVPEYRVAGSPASVSAALAQAGIAPAEIQRVLATAFTKASQNDPRFLAAVAQDAAAGKARAKGRAKGGRGGGITLDQLGAWLEKGQPATAPKRTTAGGRAKGAGTGAGRKPAAGAKPKARKPKGKATPRGRGAATPRGAPRAPLPDRLAKLQAGKALDVSKIGADGSGVKTIPMPTARSGKIVVPGLNIASDNEAAYRVALALLGPQYNNYLAAYQQEAAARLAPQPTGRVSPRASQLPGAIPLLPAPVQAQLQQVPRPISPLRQPTLLPAQRQPSPVRPQMTQPLQPLQRPPSPVRQPTMAIPQRQPSPIRQTVAVPPATRMPAQLPMLPLAGAGGLPGLPPLAPLGGLPPAGGALGARLSPRGPR